MKLTLAPTRGASVSAHPLAQFRAFAKSVAQSETTPAQQAVLLAVASHCDEQGYAFPSQKTLQELTHLSERAVRAALGELRNRGHLLLVEHATPRASARYRVVRWAQAAEQALRSTENRPERHQLPPKFPKKFPEEIKNVRTAAQAKKPDRSVQTGPSPQPGGVGDVAVRTLGFSSRAARKAANKAAWAARPRPGPTRVAQRAAPKREPSPPQGRLIADMSPQELEAFRGRLRTQLPWVAQGSLAHNF